MLSYFDINLKQITDVCEELSWDHFSVTEKSSITKIVKLLKPFALHTKLIEGDSYATISSVLPSIIELQSHLKSMSEENFPDNNILSTLQAQIERRFKYYYDVSMINFDPIFITATLFDPKFALILNSSQITASIRFIEQMKNRTAEEVPKSKLNDNLSEKSSTFLSVQNMILTVLHESNTRNESNVSSDVYSYIDYLKSQFLLDFNLTKNYFGNSVKNSDLSPFQFWTNSIIEAKFPIISKAALQILVIPATQASSERVFSISGDCSSGKRSSINPLKLEREVMFIYNKSIIDL